MSGNRSGRRNAARSGRRGGTPATLALDAAEVPYSIHTYEHEAGSTEYGAEAAAALGEDPASVFKTLMCEVDGALTVGIVPVDGRLDLKALAKATGGKNATMADVSTAERRTGYVAGGISPLGQRHRHPTVLDETALGFTTIFVSGGRRGLDIALAPADLVRLTAALVAPIRRPA